MTGGLAHHMESPRHSGQTLRQRTNVPLFAIDILPTVTNGNHTTKRRKGQGSFTPETSHFRGLTSRAGDRAREQPLPQEKFLYDSGLYH